MKSLRTMTIAGTVTAGGTSQEIAPRNPHRDLLMIQNPTGETGALFYQFGVPATSVTPSLAPGQWLKFDKAVPGEAVHVVASAPGTGTCSWSDAVGA